ncbi:adenosylcobyric acid synthase (glutamine-hydrolysing) [Desulfocapsa sulfexigens DSM 10523]|uniref:Cobyric acid synthase n=1 Tax=Desulfocapsa sulfexigens (strain DSM 10523 / SB164P1) TaxID=1167006 RepID=M1NIX6_DESSD|nr:cobyric acid synthase [Desulfocapsa sulfexigens]AGF79484.1 adenosylcobyric acid synthase (glutamine-hydrolysing) [Desulfocapsa sulfexigens DSM 10523]
MTIDTEYGHGGNIHAAAEARAIAIDEMIDFSANINPFGAPDWLRACISSKLDSILHYPDPTASVLKKGISQQYKVPCDTILVANGSTELLYQLPRVLSCKRVVIPVPCYIDYVKVMQLADIEIKLLQLKEENNFSLELNLLEELLLPEDLVIIGSPNNPTGVTVQSDKLLQLARSAPRVLFVIDEAFLEFVEGAESLAGKAENIITLHSLTKFYAIPGLRLGFGVFPEHIIKALQRIFPPWSVNCLAQAVGERAIMDHAYQEKSRKLCLQLRKDLHGDLESFPDLCVFPGSANYLLIKLHSSYTVPKLQEHLSKYNILIRDCANYQGLGPQFFRIAVRDKADNKALCSALSAFFPSMKRARNRIKPKTPAIMFQGTSSNAGKSVLTAALCRILLQDGVRVAPFKAQNMSLNSFVTADGLEMGRAQVVQAQAARLDPHVLMNPVLLKPNSDTGSQIIVRGKPLGNMSVMDYVTYKKEAMDIVSACYDELSEEYEAIILEGAGSPGEVNLKKHDIVNMRMARYAESPVILVGDIDRGGVYASFVGHMEVMSQWERQLVAGFLVNRFRGNSDLLHDAHEYVKNHTGKDVLGVIPYLHNHGIPEEDSVSFKEGLFDAIRPEHNHIEIVIISLPHISNFTDLEPFIAEPDVYLRVVSHPDKLGNPDVIILPGSKNVIGDLQHLQASGMASQLLKKADERCEIIGICGGYQMLGKSIEDPHRIESRQERVDALSLIDMHTVLAAEKTLTRKQGTHLASGQPVIGYEIHHGLTATTARSLFSYDDGSSCGTQGDTATIWGSYLHGIFDSDLFRRSFIDTVRKRKGIGAYQGPLSSYNLEPAFDRLADTVRSGLDMDRVYQLLGL